MLWLVWFLLTLPCALGVSSEGMEFRLVFMDNIVDYPLNRGVDLYMCNSQPMTANVTVEHSYFTHPSCLSPQTVMVPPDDCQRVSICSEIRHTYIDGSLSRKVVIIFSNSPISVHGFNVEKFSADSFLVLPWSLASRVYYVMSYSPQSIQTQFAVVTAEVTKIRVVIPDRVNETIYVDYKGIRYSNGESFTFILHPENSFLAQSAGDLTGVLIQSDKPVAVFTGNVRTYNDLHHTSRDHLVEQVLPVERWSRTFFFTPTPRKVLGDTLKILSAAPTTLTIQSINNTENTTFDLEPTIPLYLNGESPAIITAAPAPVLIGVVVRSQDSRQVGESDPADPSFYFLPSSDSLASEYMLPSFIDADEKTYSKPCLLLVCQRKDAKDLFIGEDNLSDLLEANSVSDNISSDNSSLDRLLKVTLRVDPSLVYKIYHKYNEKFMAIAYGASDRESYASALGYDFLPRPCQMSGTTEGDGVDNDCDGSVDEEICGNGKDDDGDKLLDEDCLRMAPLTLAEQPASGYATGTDFAIVFMSNVVRDVRSISIDEMELYVATESKSYLNITSPSYEGDGAPFIINRTANPDTVYQIRLSPKMRLSTGTEIGRSVISSKVIRVTSTSDIVVYGINKQQFSTDGFLALPTSVTGSEYFAFCYYPINTNDDRCQFAAVSTSHNLTISIDLPGGVTTDPLMGVSHTGPKTFQVNLLPYQVLEIQSQDDLTGARVYTADGQPFTFYSGNIRARVPTSKSSRDHLVEQLPPTNLWGKSFSSMPTPRASPIGDIFKVVARESNTRVQYFYRDPTREADHQLVSVQNELPRAGSHMQIDMGSNNSIHIQANHPVLVIQISKSATQRDTDPAAIVMVPEEYWSDRYRFVTLLSGQKDKNGHQLEFNSSIIVTVNKAYRKSLVFTHPDLLGTVENIGESDGWVDIPGSNHEGGVFNVRSGQGQSVLTSTNPNATWMALIFGRADRETYGNAIGLHLPAKLQTSPDSCDASPAHPGDGVDNDCDGSTDEELGNGVDDDGDFLIDEDTGTLPVGYRYVMVFQENFVEKPRNFALDVYVTVSQQMTSHKVSCTLSTPALSVSRRYNMSAILHDSKFAAGDQHGIHFAVSAELRTYGSGIQNKAVLVECNSPVTVMAANRETFSTDAFIVFPESSLGKEYYSMSFSPATLATQFAVVAVSNGITDVALNMPAEVEYLGRNQTELNVKLKQYQVFQGQSKGDLTGTHIQASQPVAVFSGNIRTKVALSNSRDHLASQIPPISSYGTEFQLVPFPHRLSGDIFRVLAAHNETSVLYEGREKIIPQAGSYIDLDVKGDGMSMITSQPVLVMQILKSQEGADSALEGDPCMMLVPHSAQFVSEITLSTPIYSKGYYKSRGYYNNYMVVLTSDMRALRFNGEQISDAPIKVIKTVPGQYLFTKLSQGVTSFTLSATHGHLFSGYLVGVADRESYCVPIINSAL